MIRFVLQRAAHGSVELACFHGWVERTAESIRNLASKPGPFGMGSDPREDCLRTAEVLVCLSCERLPIVDAYAERFYEEIIRKLAGDQHHISSEDVREWLLDAHGADLEAAGVMKDIIRSLRREGRNVESN